MLANNNFPASYLCLCSERRASAVRATGASWELAWDHPFIGRTLGLSTRFCVQRIAHSLLVHLARCRSYVLVAKVLILPQTLPSLGLDPELEAREPLRKGLNWLTTLALTHNWLTDSGVRTDTQTVKSYLNKGSASALSGSGSCKSSSSGPVSGSPGECRSLSLITVSIATRLLPWASMGFHGLRDPATALIANYS